MTVEEKKFMEKISNRVTWFIAVGITILLFLTSWTIRTSFVADRADECAKEIKQEYMPYVLVINFMQSFQYQIEEAGLYARKDSAGFARSSEKYNELRLQWMKDIKVVRGEYESGGL